MYTIHYNTHGKTHPPIWRVFLSVNEKGEFYNVMTRINTRCSLLLLGSFQTKFPTPFLCTPQYVPIHGIRFSRIFRENAILPPSLSSSLSPTKLASPVSRKTLFTRVPTATRLVVCSKTRRFYSTLLVYLKSFTSVLQFFFKYKQV